MRRGQSFDSYRTIGKEDVGFYLQRLSPSDEEEDQSTRKSVSVSHVRVEVSTEQGS